MGYSKNRYFPSFFEARRLAFCLSLALFSCLTLSFTTAVMADSTAATASVSPEKTDAIIDAVRDALIRKKYPILLQDEKQQLLSQQEKQETISKTIVSRRLKSQSSEPSASDVVRTSSTDTNTRVDPETGKKVKTTKTTTITKTRLKTKDSNAGDEAKESLASVAATHDQKKTKQSDANIFFFTVGQKYFNFNGKSTAEDKATEIDYVVFTPELELGWTSIIGRRWALTSRATAALYPMADKSYVVDDKAINSLGFDVIASYLLNKSAILNFGFAREKELFARFINRNFAGETVDLDAESVNKAKLGLTYIASKYPMRSANAVGKQGFNINLEHLFSSDHLDSALRYGLSYFHDFSVAAHVFRLDINADYVAKDTKADVAVAAGVDGVEIDEKTLGASLRYYF